MKINSIFLVLALGVIALQIILVVRTNAILIGLDEQSVEMDDLRHQFNRVNKNVDDILWYKKLEEIAYVDKVELTGPPVGVDKKISIGSLDSMYLTNPLRIKAYVFIPRGLEEDQKYPLLVLPHGGVHSNFGSGYSHIVAELITQGYVIIAPEYRGSTGYGKRFYQSIDYGGLENQDVKACRDYMLEAYNFLDQSRVGILGWSHGGMITLMNLFQYPDSYQVGFAGVPVSDLAYRLGYKNPSYEALYSAEYHIGKTLEEGREEYERRSPTTYASRLNTPLLIYTNTNDSDVRSHEVEQIISALNEANKEFEYRIFEELPGGHRFDRMDTQQARELRLRIYDFLNSRLNPPDPIATLAELNKASYFRP